MEFPQVLLVYIIILDPDRHTLVDTPFQLISGFFHVNKVLSVLSKLPPGVCWRGGGGGGGGRGGNRLAK